MAADLRDTDPVVAKKDVEIDIDGHHTAQIIAGTAVPPALLPAYLKATGEASDVRDAAKATRRPRA